MNTNKMFYRFLFLVGISGIMAACGGLSAQPTIEINDPPATVEIVATSQYPIILEANPSQNSLVWGDQSTQQDQQGAVTVDVTPVNLNDLGDTLNFEVALDTHSIDLGMDLASLATLITDNGLSIQGNFWDAPLGGHHVSGVLSFSLVETDITTLEAASQLTLFIRNLDAPERIFNWQK